MTEIYANQQSHTHSRQINYKCVPTQKFSKVSISILGAFWRNFPRALKLCTSQTVEFRENGLRVKVLRLLNAVSLSNNSVSGIASLRDTGCLPCAKTHGKGPDTHGNRFARNNALGKG